MNIESKSSTYNEGLNFIIENKFDQAIKLLLTEYKNDPGDISLVYLLLSGYLLTGKKQEMITLLRYEEDVSLFRTKLGFLRILITTKEIKTLYQLGEGLLTRGWSDDANIFFRIHSILTPDHDKSLIPLGETAIKNGQFQKGISLLSKAAENYFSNQKRGFNE